MEPGNLVRRIALLAVIVLALLPWEGAWADSRDFGGKHPSVYRDDARQWVDKVVQQFEGDDSPTAREKTVAALFDKFNEEYDSLMKRPELLNVSFFIAICDEIDRRFGEDELPAIRIMMLKILMKEIDISKRHWIFGGAHINLFNIIDKVDRRYGQDNDPTIQMLHIEFLITHELPNPGGRSMRAEIIHELDTKVKFTPLLPYGNYTAKAAAAAIVTTYDTIGQRFGPASDYAIALYLTKRGISLGGSRMHYKAAIVFFDEVERRFNKDKRPEIRLLVQDAVKLRTRYKARLSSQ